MVETDIVALFVPIVSMIVIGLVVVAFFYFRHRNKSQLQQTIQTALDKGTELTPELIDRLAGPRPGPDGDLRKALVWIAVGISFCLFGIFVGEDDAVGPLAGIGMFPLLIGIAYLVMWKFARSGE